MGVVCCYMSKTAKPERMKEKKEDKPYRPRHVQVENRVCF